MKGLHSENFETLKEKNWGRHRSLRDLLCTRITMINIWKKTSYQNQSVGPTQSPQNPNVILHGNWKNILKISIETPKIG